ncbi:hypothetical protein MTO96_019280 [Rhipicephalus appendiculatus]
MNLTPLSFTTTKFAPQTRHAKDFANLQLDDADLVGHSRALSCKYQHSKKEIVIWLIYALGVAQSHVNGPAKKIGPSKTREVLKYI